MSLAWSHSPSPARSPANHEHGDARQPIEERVRRRIVRLTRRPHQPGHRRKHDKRRHIRIASHLVQVPRRIHLGPQYRIHPLRRQRCHHRVVKNTGGVNHRRKRMLDRDIRNHFGHRRPVCDITRDHRYLRPGCAVRSPGQRHLARPGPRRLSNTRCRTPYWSRDDGRSRAAGAAGDQHRARRPGVGHRQHNLADMTRLIRSATPPAPDVNQRS